MCTARGTSGGLKTAACSNCDGKKEQNSMMSFRDNNNNKQYIPYKQQSTRTAQAAFCALCTQGSAAYCSCPNGPFQRTFCALKRGKGDPTHVIGHPKTTEIIVEQKWYPFLVLKRRCSGAFLCARGGNDSKCSI